MSDSEKKVSYKSCMVPKCLSTTIKTPGKLFFCAPRDPQALKKWCSVMKRYYDNKKPPGRYYCCEDHFDIENDMESYIKYKLVGGLLKLKKGVLPHKFDCQKPPKKIIERQAFKKREAIAFYQKVLSKDIQYEDLHLRPSEVVYCEPQKNDNVEPSDPLFVENENSEPKRTFSSKAVQAKIKPTRKTKATNTPPSWKKIKKDVQNESGTDTDCSDIETSQRSSYNFDEDNTVGSVDLELKKSLDTNFFKISMQKGALMAISREPKLILGIPEHSMFCIKHLKKFTGKSLVAIYVALRKIRWNEPNSMLAIHFGVTEKSVSTYVNEAIPKISRCMKELVFFPSEEKIRQNLPIPFRKRCSNCTSVIDCFEIQIETPSNSLHQELTLSHNKNGNGNTIKYLISITPDGLINFISEGYGGRTPDSKILEDCGILNKLPEGCTVLADRDFENVAHLLEQRGCTLLQPPSMPPSSKPTEEEAMETKSIAELRDHVERTIGKLREFNMIGPHATVDISCMNILDDIVNIACGIVNLQDCSFSRQVKSDKKLH